MLEKWTFAADKTAENEIANGDQNHAQDWYICGEKGVSPNASGVLLRSLSWIQRNPWTTAAVKEGLRRMKRGREVSQSPTSAAPIRTAIDVSVTYGGERGKCRVRVAVQTGRILAHVRETAVSRLDRCEWVAISKFRNMDV